MVLFHPISFVFYTLPLFSCEEKLYWLPCLGRYVLGGNFVWWFKDSWCFFTPFCLFFELCHFLVGRRDSTSDPFFEDMFYKEMVFNNLKRYGVITFLLIFYLCHFLVARRDFTGDPVLEDTFFEKLFLTHKDFQCYFTPSSHFLNLDNFWLSRETLLVTLSCKWFANNKPWQPDKSNTMASIVGNSMIIAF